MDKKSSTTKFNDFKHHMWITMWVTVILPPVTGISLLSFVGVFPFPEVFYPFTDYAALVVICSIIIAIKINKQFIQSIFLLIDEDTHLETKIKHLTRLPFYYFGILFLYFAVGLVATLYSLSTLHGFDYPASKYLISFLGVIPGGLITALPIFFYLTDSLGRFLAPYRLHLSVAPLKLKIAVLGLFVPILIDTLLIMYFYDRTGYLSLETLGIWFFLIVIAAIGTVMAWKSFHQSMSPFERALGSSDNHYHDVDITPQSLDELGLLSEQWQQLWSRVLSYEKTLSDSNLSLKDDVEQRTHELVSERNFINKVLENASALIVVLDRSGCIVRFNSTCETTTGFSFSELCNQPIWDWLIPPEQQESVKEVFNNLSNEGTDSRHENHLMKKDGRRVLVDWSNSTINGENGQVEYIISVGTDLTDRQTAQVALEKAKEAAENASRVKSEFLSSMSHELRTPLNAILGFGQILKLDSEDLNESQQDNVNDILDAGYHLLNLINEVLDLSRIESGKTEISMADISVDDVVQQCLALINPQAKAHHLNIIDQISNKGFIIHADFNRFKQVLLNLLSNAVKYNNDYGSITLVSETINKQHLRISIRDTGEGLSKDNISKLFMPFERFNNTYNIEGTGIGLTISKSLTELMGGHIGVESVLGKGSTFWVEFSLSS